MATRASNDRSVLRFAELMAVRPTGAVRIPKHALDARKYKSG